MPAAQTCAICGEAMDPRERQNYHIIKRSTGEAKHGARSGLRRPWVSASGQEGTDSR